MPIAFTKVDLPYGWMGNMAPFPVMYDGKKWRTTEALFQALRFADSHSRERIRAKTSPMGAKMTAKKIAKSEPGEAGCRAAMGKQDLANMKMVLRLKLKQHPELKQQLLDTGDETIIEDSSNRKGETAKVLGCSPQGRPVGRPKHAGQALDEVAGGTQGASTNRPRRLWAPSSSDDALKAILKVKSWAAEVGGIKRLKELIEALSE